MPILNKPKKNLGAATQHVETLCGEVRVQNSMVSGVVLAVRADTFCLLLLLYVRQETEDDIAKAAVYCLIEDKSNL